MNRGLMPIETFIQLKLRDIEFKAQHLLEDRKPEEIKIPTGVLEVLDYFNKRFGAKQ